MGFERIFNRQEWKRYSTALILIGILAILLVLNQPFLIWLALGLCFLGGFHESLRLFFLSNHPLLYFGACCAWILAYLSGLPVESGLFVLMIIAGLMAYKKRFLPKNLLPFIYPTLPFLALYALYERMGVNGNICLIWLIVIVAFTDTGAYFGGRALGKIPLSPTSPNKTLEGAGIGVACGVLGGSLIGIGPSQSFIVSVIISTIVALSSILGDLFESYLKREAGVKDSGKLLPGHGGILDRFDAILFGSVAMYFLLCFLPVWKQL